MMRLKIRSEISVFQRCSEVWTMEIVVFCVILVKFGKSVESVPVVVEGLNEESTRTNIHWWHQFKSDKYPNTLRIIHNALATIEVRNIFTKFQCKKFYSKMLYSIQLYVIQTIRTIKFSPNTMGENIQCCLIQLFSRLFPHRLPSKNFPLYVIHVRGQQQSSSLKHWKQNRTWVLFNDKFLYCPYLTMNPPYSQEALPSSFRSLQANTTAISAMKTKNIHIFEAMVKYYFKHSLGTNYKSTLNEFVFMLFSAMSNDNEDRSSRGLR